MVISSQKEKEKSNIKETQIPNPLQSVRYHLESDLQIYSNSTLKKSNCYFSSISSMKVGIFVQKGIFGLVAFIKGHFQVSLLLFCGGCSVEGTGEEMLYVFLLIGRKKTSGTALRYCSQYLRWNVPIFEPKIWAPEKTKQLLRLNDSRLQEGHATW